MQTIVFLFPNLTGHLNPTLQIASEHRELGNKVFYAGTFDIMPFAQRNGYEFFSLNSLPFATGFEDAVHQDKQEKWLESLLDRHSNKSYKERKADIKRLIKELNPNIIFLDEFNYSDFILLYPYLEGRRVILLQTKFPMYYNENVPPLNTFAFPGSKAKGLWRSYFLKRTFREIWQRMKYLGKSDLGILKQKFKENGLPEKYSINTRKVFKPTFDNLEEWFLVKKELDFKEQVLYSWQHYVEPKINIDREEEITQTCRRFVEKAKEEQHKLIYCSLGTVLKIHVKGKEKVVTTFFQNIIDIASEQPHYWFYVVVDKDFLKSLKPESSNIKLVTFAPQIYLLKNADLFLTHSGPGSIFEGEATHVPMLLFPLNNNWDQNGTAARVVHSSLGKKSDLTVSKTTFLKQIETFFEKI